MVRRASTPSKSGSQDRRRHLGRLGEEAAVRFLKTQGYSILARNYRCRWGEIDIVARQGATLVFVEVRTRTGTQMGLPQESLDFKKQSRLRRLAAYYLHRTGLGEVDCRFDVVAVTAEAGGKELKLELFVDAF